MRSDALYISGMTGKKEFCRENYNNNEVDLNRLGLHGKFFFSFN